jgi:DNA-binding response OmpR family regulator
LAYVKRAILTSVPQPRILIVEDDAELRAMLRAVLTLEGFDVDVARNGYEGLQRIDRNPPQLVLLDLGLPDVGGLIVLDDLAARRDTRNIPVVVVTGSTESLKDVDARCILRKPVSPDQIVSAVKDCLANGDPRRSA